MVSAPEDLQAFRRHPPMWKDGEQTREPRSDPSSAVPRPQTTAISWPLTSFENTIQNVCCISFLLGLFFAINLLSLLFFCYHPSSSSPAAPSLWIPLNLYALLLILFHLLEFLTTAIFNPSRVTVDSFLLNNGASYWYAQLMSVTEHVIRARYLPSQWGLNMIGDMRLLRMGGLMLTMVGQVIRTKAMITAAQSFNHRVSTDAQKQEDHSLVTHGVYRLFRHPSYFGFFWWSIGIQLFLANPCSLVLFSFVLWSFFNARIQNEELHLIKFFGKAYVDYRATTSTYIPFIR